MTQPRLLGGRYELDGVVGRGGMAEVYRARDIRLDRQVAVKTLRSDMARDHTFQARFRREAQSAASLNHPSVIAVYDTGEDADGDTPVPYIVMEYVDGRTLRELLNDDRRLLPERAIEIVDGVLHALDYSHRGGIVHRDIKPANVMMTAAGDVKVMDFGIARAIADTAATMTQTAQVIGTAQYLSPEQARGERVDSRSDIYSTGCVLYELLTGQPPFTGDSPVAIAYQHVRENPIPPSQVDPEVPQWADTIVFKAMAKDPNERYQTAADMRSDIQRALSGMAIAAPTRAMGGAPPERTPPYEEYPEEKSGRGKRAALWALLALLFIGGAILVAVLLLGGSEGEDVAVPDDLVGLSQQAAEDRVTDAGLEPEVEEEFNGDQDEGNVFRTDPEPGSTASEGDTVTLFVSRGPEEVAVPNLIDQSRSEAETLLEQRGLRLGEVDRQQSTRDKGTVLESSPAAGDQVRSGSRVDITVSRGGSEVPNVVGQSAEDAEATLRDAGFDVQRETDQGGRPGTVIRQDPAGGETARSGATITIVVSEPGQTTEPPPTDDDDNGDGDDDFPFPNGNGNGPPEN